jgi:ribosomal protein S18 acetylase RimI-like enzyme
MMEITEFTPDYVDAVQAFLGRIPAGESAFFKEDVSAPDTAKQWLADGADRARYLAVDDGAVVGLTSVIPGAGWSSHVGEIRLVVDPDRRRGGVGKALARRALVAAIERDLRKLVVEVVADQEPAIRLFTELGFTPEAVLADHVRDRNGELHDLMVLAHDVEDVRSAMATMGITDELG